MTLELLEGAVTALLDYLSANIAARLDVIDARYADSITLDDIKLWYQGALPFNQPEVPSIALVGERWRPKNQQSSFTGVGCDIGIIVMVGEADPETRFKKLCRYAMAIIELLHEDTTTGYENLVEGDITLSDVLATPDFLQAIKVPVRMFQVEDY